MSNEYQARTLDRGFLDLLRNGSTPVQLSETFFPDVVKMANSKVAATRQNTTSSSKAFGAKHIFDIPTSNEFIGNMYLSLTFGAGTNVSGAVGCLAAINSIDRITFKSGKTILEYTGQELLQYTHLINQSNPDSLVALYDTMGGDSGDVSPNGTIAFKEYIVGIALPGLIEDAGYRISGLVGNDSGQNPFPVGLLRANLQVEVTFYPASRVYTALDGVTEWYTQPVLYYDRLSQIPVTRIQEESSESFSDPGFRLGYWWSQGNFAFGTSWGVYSSFTAGTPKTESSGIQGSTSNAGEVLCVMLQAVTDGSQDSKNHLKGERLNKIVLTAAGQELFELDSKEQLEYFNLIQTGGKNNINIGNNAGTSYWYEIPLSYWPIDLSQLGTNLNSQVPILSIETTNTSADNFSIPIVSFYKCMYKFENGACTPILTL